MRAERSRERRAFLWSYHEEIGVAEIVAAVPERRERARRGAEVENRRHRLAADAERPHGRRVMVADRGYVRTRLVDFAMNDALGIELDGRWIHGARLEIEFENIAAFDQFGRARTRQQIAPGLIRMAPADMPERVDHALMGEDAIGHGKLVAQEYVRHGVLSQHSLRLLAAPGEYPPCSLLAPRTCPRPS